MTKGIYVLVISISEDIRIDIGALGSIDFAKGSYAYVGSAQSGLEKRVQRHLRKTKRKFWHIDYLLDDNNVKVLKVFCKEAGKPDECEIAKKINRKGFPIKNFGSSDCKCVSHLFELKNNEVLEELMLKTRMYSEY
jgi:Uri superfamily endonuclease